MKICKIFSLIFLIACLSSTHLQSSQKGRRRHCIHKSKQFDVLQDTHKINGVANDSHDGPETIIHTIPKPIEAPKINGVPNVRFVKVLSGPGSDSYLQISQLVVRDEKGDNVAKGKPAFSSTNWTGTRPEIAVDGHEGARSFPLIYMSNTINNAWWMVDLQKDEFVTQIRYYNRADCCNKRILGARVQLLDKNNELMSEFTISHDGPETIIHAVYDNGLPGKPTLNVRFVKVISAEKPDAYLQISQMVVRNKKGENIAKGKPTFSSTNWPGTLPEKAVDGYEAARSYPAIYMSNTPYNGWWIVDLQSNHDIVQIRYYNRADCCNNRIVGAKVLLLDENKNLLSEYIISDDDPETIIHTLPVYTYQFLEK